MGKKSKRNRSKSSKPDNADDRLAPPLRTTPVETEETKDNLRFADPFVEEYVEEEYIVADADDDDDGKPPAMDEGEGATTTEIVQAWNPLSKNTTTTTQPTELEMDATAYKMHHALTPEWPCLSFDFIRDDHGDQRTRFPHTLIAAIGTQAAQAHENQLTILRVSDMAKMDVETEDDILGEELRRDTDDGASSSSSEEEEEEIDLDPVMEHYSIPHRNGGVNRVRVMPQNPDIVATWSDGGSVNLFNVAAIRQRFGPAHPTPVLDIPTQPFFTYTHHETEGFALDWSRVKTGHLLTGDCAGAIHHWVPRPEGGYAVAPFLQSSSDHHNNHSIEDLQWSPSEATVFASAECNGYVRIFDTRARNKAMLSHQIHANSVDVNVLSWNHLVNNLLATGGDDGTLSVWDLRQFSSATPTPLARFTPHTTPISSVEWHPVDESMLAATDDVGAYVYDLSVEEDDDTAAAVHSADPDVPPQLLFVHCGSEQFKEVHWHPQISSCLMTTALTGFSMFIPSNL